MKLQLLESGIQNIRSLASQYNKAKIYYHIDLDGVTSAIAMKFYLQRYGIQTVAVQKIQYGGLEYAISKPAADVLPVLVDFAHGKIFMKIHTDHHENQIEYDNSAKHFQHAKSNAGVISSIISPSDIFPKEDVRVINMVDSAGYAEENISVDQMRQAVIKYKKGSDNVRNHLEMGMVVGKLLLTYKNKPGYLDKVVLDSNPSLISMYNVMMGQIINNISKGIKGWALPSQIEKNAEWYTKQQEQKSIPNGTLRHIEELSYGQNTVVGNTIVQVGGGLMNRAGSYDRYTAFKLHPEAQYFIMIWDSIGMMQVSKNNWNKKNENSDVNLGDIVIRGIFENKYIPLLNKPKYDISLLAIKKTLEENITEDIEEDAIGFTYDEFVALFNKTYDVDEDQQKRLEKAMNIKPSDVTPKDTDTPMELKQKMNIINFLNGFTLPLSEIILKTSGGHPGITNLSGFAFLNTQQRIDRKLKFGHNPYEKYVPSSDKKPVKLDTPRRESTSLKILRSIAKDVVKELNK